MKNLQEPFSPRRKFLGTLAAGAAALGLQAIPSTLQAAPSQLAPGTNTDPDDPDAWFNQINGKHRMVFDVREPLPGHEAILPFAWPKVFLMTNAATGTPEKENSVVVVLRHNAIPYAMEDRLWEKYGFGERFKITDPGTEKASLRNVMWKPNPPFKVPGVGPVPIGINDLQESGVMFCVCDMALNVNSFVVAQSLKMKPEEVKKDWLAGLLPGIKVMPSGLWALGRAQEHQCAYIAV
ncbi:MAG: twin-arginine translocation signal domain-containing protein [Chitinophagaceae bacterium]|nr:twin-arginine translocation signal domain-containing protein [Chitinophagaceae bacterium]MBL0057025.1 twin-arginine translocation signal domain-containing protein [Chitinophagaceae bacterium]